VDPGNRWEVDLNLEKLLDRINHDVLMVLVARKVGVKRVSRLNRHYLQAGIRARGLVKPASEGTQHRWRN
jgi:RNA-directed DNA polymerase